MPLVRKILSLPPTFRTPFGLNPQVLGRIARLCGNESSCEALARAFTGAHRAVFVLSAQVTSPSVAPIDADD